MEDKATRPLTEDDAWPKYPTRAQQVLIQIAEECFRKYPNNKEFVPYEQALALKELGFDEPCFGCYDEKGVFGLTVMSIKQYYTNSKEDTWNCAAPLYQQAFRWFREKHNYAGFIQLVEPEYGGDYGYVIYYKLNHLAVDHWNKGFKTYEEAEQACLDKLIEIVKNEKS